MNCMKYLRNKSEFIKQPFQIMIYTYIHWCEKQKNKLYSIFNVVLWIFQWMCVSVCVVSCHHYMVFYRLTGSLHHCRPKLPLTKTCSLVVLYPPILTTSIIVNLFLQILLFLLLCSQEQPLISSFFQYQVLSSHSFSSTVYPKMLFSLYCVQGFLITHFVKPFYSVRSSPFPHLTNH